MKNRIIDKNRIVDALAACLTDQHGETVSASITKREKEEAERNESTAENNDTHAGGNA